MRINPANSSPIQNADSASVKKSDNKLKSNAYENKNSAPPTVSENGSAKAEISSKARDMATAKQVAMDAPDVREAKIADLKNRIQNKQYNVTSEAISDKLVDDHLKLVGA